LEGSQTMGGGRIFLETFRVSLFNEDLLNEPSFSLDPSLWTVPLRPILDQYFFLKANVTARYRKEVVQKFGYS
jgi:hypothetical protein